MVVLHPPQQLPDEGMPIGDAKPLLLVDNLEQVLFQSFFGDSATIIVDSGLVELNSTDFIILIGTT